MLFTYFALFKTEIICSKYLSEISWRLAISFKLVGYALHVNPDPEGIPCYRVVNREGRVSEAFAFGGENRQIGLLEADGIEVKDGCVDLSKYQWRKEIF